MPPPILFSSTRLGHPDAKQFSGLFPHLSLSIPNPVFTMYIATLPSICFKAPVKGLIGPTRQSKYSFRRAPVRSHERSGCLQSL